MNYLNMADQKENGASDGLRTHDLIVGNDMLYQLSYTRVRELRSIQEPYGFGKWFLALKIINDYPFTTRFEDVFDKLNVQWMLLISVLCSPVLEDKVQRHLIGLINHITVAFSHFAAMIVHYARAGLEIFFSSGEQFFGGIRYIRFGPENDYVGKHCLGW